MLFRFFYLAENIRESEFFKTAIGSVINGVATIDTTHFSKLTGVITFKNGGDSFNSKMLFLGN